jgi:hypothetical protein
MVLADFLNWILERLEHDRGIKLRPPARECAVKEKEAIKQVK